MKKYTDMCELLESDSRAMSFFNSLPVTLQRKLYEKGTESFEALYNAAAAEGKADTAADSSLSAVSCNECTGLFPEGNNCTLSEWEQYKNIEGFGVPTRQDDSRD